MQVWLQNQSQTILNRAIEVFDNKEAIGLRAQLSM